MCQPWPKTLQEVQMRMQQLAAQYPTLWHGVALLPAGLMEAQVEDLRDRLNPGRDCVASYVVTLGAWQQVHWFFGPQEAWDNFFPLAKRTGTFAKEQLGEEAYPPIALPDEWDENKKSLLRWMFWLYHFAWNDSVGQVQARWQYLPRRNHDAVDDNRVCLAAALEIQESLGQGNIQLESWPNPSPMADVALGRYFTLTHADDGLGRACIQYWNEPPFYFPALFYASFDQNVFKVSENAIEFLLAPETGIEVDVDGCCAKLDGQSYTLGDRPRALFLDHIAKASPHWITFNDMKAKAPELEDCRSSRLKQRLHRVIRSRIESGNRGFRWSP